MAELKGVDDVGNMKTAISSSLSGVERRFDENKHGSILAFEDNSKCHEPDMQLSEGGASTQPTSVKSEISEEMHLPLRNGSHESHNAAESSCSNSLPIVLPISISNQNYQETSKEAHMFRNYGSSMDSCNVRSPQEPITVSSESGISAQIASKAIRNAKERNSMVSAMASNGEEEVCRKWDHETATPEDDGAEQTEIYKWMSRDPGTVGKSCVSYDNLDSESTHCRERMDEISRGGEKKPSRYAVEDQDKSFAGFDLNEDINMNNMLDDFIQPVGETVSSSHGVIHVVAKAAKLIGHPRIPLTFEGGLGWTGSAQTSAFRPAKNLSDRKTLSTDDVPKDELRSAGFDLNVAAIDDNEGVLQDSHSEVDSKQTNRPLIDLNCLYDANDELIQPKSENRADLNLNSLTSVAEKSNSLHWLPQGNKISDICYTGRQDFDKSDFAMWTNLNTMRHLVNGHHTLGGAPNFFQPVELMQRVASTQSKLPFMSPPHGYSYKDPFHFGSGSMPYARFYGNAPHLQQVVHDHHNTSHIPSSIPKFFDVKTEDSSSISGSIPRQFPFLPKSGEHLHQEAWYAASTKRKEPEGGLECYQLGYKQVL